MLGERSKGADLFFFFVNFLFSSFGQEVKCDVMGGVHPDCLVYPLHLVCGVYICEEFSSLHLLGRTGVEFMKVVLIKLC